MIQAKNIYKFFGKNEILKGVNIMVKEGSMVCILGESGVGKSTLLHILGTLEKPTINKKIKTILKINKKEILSMTDDELSSLRNQKIGFIFQTPQLLPEFTVLENICLPGLINKKNKEYVKKKAINLLKKFNLYKYENSKIEELSGGQKQRLSVARALINNPKIIFADEPSGNLDQKNAEELHNFFSLLNHQFKQTFLIVTHNLQLANMADEKLKIENGIIYKIDK
ncbi:Lipoprotein-releasing system ATP-binding protein LolD [Blattabacterium sp. (Nauphoeta cinerea)]|uniref:ABC transporter ATP-binding protein n=1 Tax=Blattabacterium sp. (Nauphoeta cinerea) TaxID=1316444 RepID=UPI0003B085E7|nr:ABC transporter ATP-binding protein [Blattabacterium sp. (Nauphoeta cinerea)]AGW86338.1 Lipoprotein-releasing system ATP-binding protein LolD [Blattabacterium sp. (Nauphoeta cinerea)]